MTAQLSFSRAALSDPALFREAALIDGAWVSAGANVVPVTDPATGEVIGVVPALGPGRVEEAIASAEAAQRRWRDVSAAERGAVVRRIGTLMIEHIDDLAQIMTAEQGKPIEEARGEIRYAAGFAEWFGEEARRVYGETIPSPWPDRRIMVMRQPIGVVAAITPWNFPAGMVTRKAMPAIAAGCSVVLKPAEQTPFSALAIGMLAQRAGLPDGVFNIVTGDARTIGGVLCESEVVRKLTFTGSTEVGRILMRQCAPTVKKLGLELGGNAPFIVLDDADLDAAVAGAMASKYRNAGQTCVCANRFLVQRDVYAAFVEKLAAASGALVVADGRQPGAQQGPLIDADALAKVEALVADAIAGGARVVTGGARAAAGALFYQPTVLADVTGSMRIVREEVFGPVAPIIVFDDDAECLALANASEYGLAAYLYGRDLARVWRMMEALEVGIVGVNSGVISTEVAPFGGIKQSGVGREGGRDGLLDFTELKYVCLGGL